MTKISVYNLEGKETGTIELAEHIFDVKLNSDLMHQVTVSLLNNQRVYTAHTKNKGEVRGGGKKPWKQKGTGRARAGSNRSPIWKGGGITFGPRNERNYLSKINKKVGRLAFLMALSAKLRDKEIRFVDSFDLDNAKTKGLSNILTGLSDGKKSVLVVTEKQNANLKRASLNLEKVKTTDINNTNTLDLLSKKIVLIEKGAVKILEEKFKAESSSKKVTRSRKNDSVIQPDEQAK